MIEASRVSVVRSAPGRSQVAALSGVCLRLAAGELGLILGVPGSGKTTLLEALAGVLPVSGGEVALGDAGGTVWRWGAGAKAPREARRAAGLLFQYPERQLFGKTALEDVSWGLGEGGAARAEEALARVDLPPEFYECPVGRLSRGEKRRVALAGVLAREPGVLLLDEPSVGLDARGRALLWREIDAYRRERGAAVVVATHWPEPLLALADRVLCLKGGEMGFWGAPPALLAAAEADPELGGLLPFSDRLRLALRGAVARAGAGAPARPSWVEAATLWFARSGGREGGAVAYPTEADKASKTAATSSRSPSSRS